MNNTMRKAGRLIARAQRKHVEWVSLIALLAVSCLVSACFFINDLRQAHSAETAQLESQARIIDENLRHQLDGARGALENLRRAWTGGSHFDTAALDAVKSAMPGVRALILFDQQGKLMAASSGAAIAQGASLKRLAAATRDGHLYLSPQPPQAPGPAAGILLALGIPASAGQAGAVVAAQLDAAYFDVVMRSVLYAPDMRTAIFDSHAGALLYTPPGASAAELSVAFPHRQLSAALASNKPGNVFFARADGASDERIVVQRHFSPATLDLAAPLNIALSRSVTAMSLSWLKLAVVYFSAWLLVATLLTLILLVLQLRRRTVSENATLLLLEQQQNSARVELALAGADLGLWDWHLPSGTRTLNLRGAAMLGYAPEQLAQITTFYQLLHPEDLDSVQTLLNAHLCGQTAAYDAQFRMQHRQDGWVWVHSRGRIVEVDDSGQPVRIMGTRMDITARKIAEEKIHQLAFYDSLTELPNRRLLLQRLAQMLAKSTLRKRYSAVLFLDLDQFKQLNDTLGHDVGDKLLQSVAHRLLDVVRCHGTVARLGGDEFIVLLEEIAGTHDEARQVVELIGADILHCIERPHLLDGHECRSAGSIGATVFANGDGQSKESLLKQADLAMYQAKSDGRATLRFFDPAMQRRIVESVAMEEDLHSALLRQQFALHYQPIVDARGCERGVEALLRWTHPQRGAVRPDVFIAVAEKTGLILQLGHWVMEQACKVLVEWAGQAAKAELTIAVNVSVRQFRQPDFVARVISVLRQTGAPANRLKLELTESMLLEDIDEVREKMQALQSLGIAFSLDDFGTGYSSLSYLKKLPLSQLKIDRSFVQDVLSNANDAAIARSIIALARSLTLEVVAEGVETQAQFNFLNDHGCTFFQGYLFGKPAPLAASHALC